MFAHLLKSYASSKAILQKLCCSFSVPLNHGANGNTRWMLQQLFALWKSKDPDLVLSLWLRINSSMYISPYYRRSLGINVETSQGPARVAWSTRGISWSSTSFYKRTFSNRLDQASWNISKICMRQDLLYIIVYTIYIYIYISTHTYIIASWHDLAPKGSFVRESPSVKSRLVNYNDLA